MKRRNFAITFEKEQLNRLVQDESSCVSLKQCTHHLALHPYHLTNINESLKTILNKGIAKYDKTLDGILLGYQNMKLLSSSGAINNDTCFIHVDISADFFLFKPEVGKTLTGVVNKMSEDHVGCLVHEAFNVSLPKPPGEDDWLGALVQPGQEILLQINLINLEGRLPYIRASLVSILSELDSGISTGEDTKSHKKKLKAKKIIFNSNSEGEELELTAETKRQKRKRKITDELLNRIKIDYDEPDEPQKLNGMEEPNIEHTKKKKRKIKIENNSDVQTSYEERIEVPKYNDSESKKSKKKKKIKLEYDSVDETQNFEIEEIKTSHKHKKKHKTKH